MMSTVSPVLFAGFLSPVEVKRWCLTSTLVFQRNRFLLDLLTRAFGNGFPIGSGAGLIVPPQGSPFRC